jgi:hypothetical protein
LAAACAAQSRPTACRSSSVRKFVKNLRRYRTIQIQAGDHTITAAAPLPADVHHTLEAIKTRATAH